VLVELRLENYAVIDQLAVEFGAGLNLLTGETGAGKSILIDALALLMGDKASPDVIRFGADRALLSAVFEVEAASEKRVAEILAENGIDAEDGNVILRRVPAAGRVSSQSAPTVAVLKQLSAPGEHPGQNERVADGATADKARCLIPAARPFPVEATGNRIVEPEQGGAMPPADQWIVQRETEEAVKSSEKTSG
jgi:energy-coupling factor transporter ATP-binding protein EcfA2